MVFWIVILWYHMNLQMGTNVLTKHWYPSESPHEVTTQKTSIGIFTTVKISELWCHVVLYNMPQLLDVYFSRNLWIIFIPFRFFTGKYTSDTSGHSKSQPLARYYQLILIREQNWSIKEEGATNFEYKGFWKCCLCTHIHTLYHVNRFTLSSHALSIQLTWHF
jgi:hypothetical protein